MQYPNLVEEKALWKQGYKSVVSLDEAGRGPLAGPVVAAAVSLKKDFRTMLVIKDSKKISEKKREFLYRRLTKNKNISWGVGIVSEVVIDDINIFNATKLAMKRALKNIKLKPDFLIIDGNFALNNISVAQKSIIKADEKVFSCVAAGIIAKVTRDGIMRGLDNKYPCYGFNQHKGYGTKMHLEALQKFGPCKIHRKSFFPVRAIYKRDLI